MKTLVFQKRRGCLNANAGKGANARAVRGGFTLIEVVVVIAIAAIVSAITVGAFRSVSAGHKRTACQTNLTQIYLAGQMYAADEGGKFPFYDPAASSADDVGADGTTVRQNLGLWALYTFSNDTDPSALGAVGAKPVERYVRNSKSLHCPNDYGQNGQNVDLYTDESRTTLNPRYLSYQINDPNSGIPTYDSIRTTNKPPAYNASSGQSLQEYNDLPWFRQLLPYNGVVASSGKQSFRTPSDKTVITWCPWHRTGLSGRQVDPVLFFDGSVQLVPVKQTDPDNATNPATLQDWMRKPRREEP